MGSPSTYQGHHSSQHQVGWKCYLLGKGKAQVVQQKLCEMTRPEHLLCSKSPAKRRDLSTCCAAKVLRNDAGWALVCAAKVLQSDAGWALVVQQKLWDISVARGQGNDVDKRNFFLWSHLRGAAAKIRIFNFFPFLTLYGYKSLILYWKHKIRSFW